MTVSDSTIEQVTEFVEEVGELLAEGVEQGLTISEATQILGEVSPKTYELYSEYEKAIRQYYNDKKLRRQNEADTVEEYNNA